MGALTARRASRLSLTLLYAGEAICGIELEALLLVLSAPRSEGAFRSGIQVIAEQSVTLELTRDFSPLYPSRGACSFECVPARGGFTRSRLRHRPGDTGPGLSTEPERAMAVAQDRPTDHKPSNHPLGLMHGTRFDDSF
jgi:hypothetical protein